jgi:very-short-patch-repair endonuclease
MAHGDNKPELARSLRQNAIPAEQLLWKALRNRALGGFKFRRQHQIGPHFADFACVACMVVVEADGTSHLTNRRRDQRRTSSMEKAGWKVMRFWNTEIYDELDAVKEAIYRECVARQASGAPPSP